ncbi:MAG: fatty acid desaturase, partial [Hyphomicrobiales bacterium]
MAVTLAALSASVAVLFLSNVLWLQVANAVVFALVTTQLSFLGHDLCHNQVFARPVTNFRFGLAFVPVVGLSPSWWREKHNRHHAEPNDVEHDPDVNFPMLAFSEPQAASKGRIARWFVRYQAFLVVPLLFFEGLNMKLHSALYLVGSKCRSRARWLELALVVLHPLLLSTVLLLALPFSHAV